MMHDAKLTVRLPEDELDFAREYAQAHGVTMTDLILRFFRGLRETGPDEIHPEIRAITGILPRKTDARAEYREHLLRKHQ